MCMLLKNGTTVLCVVPVVTMSCTSHIEGRRETTTLPGRVREGRK